MSSAGGSIVLRVVGYLLVTAVVCVAGFAAYTAVMAAYEQRQVGGSNQEVAASALNSVRNAFGFTQSQGVAVGRAVPGQDPPSIADRLSAPSARHTVSATQEVVMTGAPLDANTSGCLGGEKEVLLELENDVDADQLDITYTFVNSSTDKIGDGAVIGSCGKASMVKQCIPLPPEGHVMRLQSLAYFMDDDGMLSVPPKKRRIHPMIFTSDSLKSSDQVFIKASEFTAVATEVL